MSNVLIGDAAKREALFTLLHTERIRGRRTVN